MAGYARRPRWLWSRAVGLVLLALAAVALGVLVEWTSQAGNYQVYWRVKAVPVGSKSRRQAQMDGYLLATKAAQLFPS